MKKGVKKALFVSFILFVPGSIMLTSCVAVASFARNNFAYLG